MRQELVVRSLTGRRHPGAEEESSALDFPIPLRTLDLDCEVLGVATGRKDRAESVVRVSLEVLDEVLTGIVLGPPARVAFVTEVRVGVDQGGDDGFPSEIDRDGSGGCGELSGGPHLDDSVTFHEEISVFDYVSVAEDEAGTFEEEGPCWERLGIRWGTSSRKGRGEADQRRDGDLRCGFAGAHDARGRG